MFTGTDQPERAFAKRTNWLLVLTSLVIVVVAGLLFHNMVESYIIDQSEKRICDVMLERRALHHYIQRNMHPDMYALKSDGELPTDFYSPVLLSSSYMARNVHAYFNEERRAAGYPDIEYRMASVNPRNPINQATEEEAALIEMFDKDSTLTEYRRVIELDGRRYLYYARPFLRVTQACLKCHGDPEDPPRLLRERYINTTALSRSPGALQS